MRIPFLSGSSKRGEQWLILDIGSSSIKYAVGVRRHSTFHITHSGLEEVQNGDWESGLASFLDSFRRTFPGSFQALVSLPSSVLKARMARQRVLRRRGGLIGNKEAEDIANEVAEVARKEMLREVAATSGITPSEWMVLRLAILRMSVEGYEVRDIAGHRGEELEYTIFSTICLRSAYNSLDNLCKAATITVERVMHESEAVSAFSKDALYINVGETATQLFFVQRGDMQGVAEIPIGGRDITRALQENLGIPADQARAVKERYRQGIMEGFSEVEQKQLESCILTEYMRLYQRIQEIPEKLAWNVPDDVFVYGGSALPNPTFTLLFPEHILDILPSHITQQTQYTPLAFLCYGNT